MTLKEILNKKNEALLSVPDEFLSKIQKVQKQFFMQLNDLIDSIEKSNGFIDATGKNLTAVSSIDLKEILNETDYNKIVDDFSKAFSDQKDINDKYFDEINDKFKPSSFADKVLEQAQKDAVIALTEAPLDQKFLKPIEDILFDSVATGASWKDTVTAIRDFVEGSDEEDGKLLQYSKQIAHDNFAYADRAYSNVLADDMEAEWFFYSGDTIDSSRCFCVERHEKYFHYKEIEAWGRGENLGKCKSGDLWAGADPNTNEKTIFLFAGGFNCGHTIMPVSVFDVPKEVLQRNIANGNYEPSDAEAEELGL